MEMVLSNSVVGVIPGLVGVRGAKLGWKVSAGKQLGVGVALGMRSRSELKLLPNVLSFSRVLLAAAFVPADTGLRIGLLSAAALTDFMDGWLARRVNAATRSGALIDPISDRFFVVVALSTFLYTGAVTWLEFFVFLSRDIMTAVGFVVARAVSWLRPVEFKARFPGKVVTTLQLITLFVLLLAPAYGTPLIVLVGVTSVWAIVDYTVALWRARVQ